MMKIVATNVVASQPPERRPTATPTARAKSFEEETVDIEEAHANVADVDKDNGKQAKADSFSKNLQKKKNVEKEVLHLQHEGSGQESVPPWLSY